MAKLGAKPFFFKGGSEGVLLIHGYTGAPGEMRLLGECCCRGTAQRRRIWRGIPLTTGMPRRNAVLKSCKRCAAGCMWPGFRWAGC